MTNQMTSTLGEGEAATMSHGASLVRSKKDDRTSDRLPFSGGSIPEFLPSCPPGSMITGLPSRWG